MLLFLPATLWLISNNYINRHYHILSSGEIIAHSHPYSNCSQSPVQDHDHTDLEYTILAQIASNSNSEGANNFSVQPDPQIKGCKQQIPHQHIKSNNAAELPRLRAPPAI